ncbi:MAG: hypothetical protein COS89_00335 [Deltaproteobacteria bacterium CG07_land_8_20_14_0_80_38_7]|nr:MAG: hypothetical protein COS89_00335 [Deltaproteobacteria bacterium CG07_land_8_20_14_0_80_38_7]
MNGFEPKQFGKYYLIEKLAVGGMAEIYKAKTFGVDGFEKLLAIKRILPHCVADKDFISMLIDEAKLSVLLSHANIVQVFDLGKIADDYFIAMEYIQGINLRDVMYKCREFGKIIPEDIAVFIISEVCKGLDYAHRKQDSSGQPLNIVHRDVSPQNILLSYEGEVKIVDFGIAKAAMNISHTMAGILKGKIAYMSPEQAMGKTINRQTDVFSAGILLYEMLTNTKLFTGESQFEVLKKIRTSKVEANSLPELVPAQLKSIVAKALAYKPENRYQYAGDFQLDLTKYLYSTYIDFSPRKLSQFIKEVFAEDLKQEQIKRAQTAALESQTASMNVDEGAKQIDIVHRDTAITAFEKTQDVEDEDAEQEERTPAQVVENTKKTKLKQTKQKPPDSKQPKTKSKKWHALIPVLGVLIVGLYVAYKYVPSLHFWEQPQIDETVTFGIANIESEPKGAKIFIDGSDTKLSTPADIKDLKVNQDYKIRLEKEGFAAAEKTIRLTSELLETVSIKMEEAKGVLNIISEPSGATILLDGRTTGNVTPATLENLALNTDLKITLTKPDYKDFDQIINLQSSIPQRVSTELEKVTGDIFVTSKPDGAMIYIDNKDSGKVTPANIKDLKIKESYVIKLDKDGYKSWTKKVDVSGVETVNVEGELVQDVVKEVGPVKEPVIDEKPPVTEKPKEPGKEVKKSTVKETKKEPTKEPVKEREPVVDEEPVQLKGESGRIRISSKPTGAQVFINSYYKGDTPITVEVRPGKVSVLVNKEGHLRYSKKVSVKPGQKVDLTNINLGGLYGEVSLSSSPSRAKVIFDNKEISAKTPVTIRKVRRDQPHTIMLKLKGYKVWSRSFNMEDGDKDFNVTLESE